MDQGFEDLLILPEQNGDLDDVDFHSVISSAHCILPLIHPSKTKYQDYLYDKFSGAFALSVGHQVPMLLSSSFKNFHHFEGFHFFYGDFLETCLKSKNLTELDHKKNQLQAYRKQHLNTVKFT